MLWLKCASSNQSSCDIFSDSPPQTVCLTLFKKILIDSPFLFVQNIEVDGFIHSLGIGCIFPYRPTPFIC